MSSASLFQNEFKTDFLKKIFPSISDDSNLIKSYSCAIIKDVLIHGRLYILMEGYYFYSNLFGFQTTAHNLWKEVTSIKKEKTAKIIPNAIVIVTPACETFFTSFSKRDKIFDLLFNIWENSLTDKPLNMQSFLAKFCDNTSENNLESLNKTFSDNSPDNSSLKSVQLQEITETSPTLLEQSDECVCDKCLEEPQHLSFNFNCSVDTLIELIFDKDSHPLKTYINNLNLLDYKATTWDVQDKIKKNVVTYKMPIGIIKKLAEVTVKQTLQQLTKNHFQVNCSSTQEGVPYSGRFEVLTIYCIKELSSEETKLDFYSSVSFAKDIWSVTKSMINKECQSNISRHIELLCSNVQSHLSNTCNFNTTLNEFDEPNDSSEIQIKTSNSNQRNTTEKNNSNSSSNYTAHLSFSNIFIIILFISISINAYLFMALYNFQDNTTKNNLMPENTCDSISLEYQMLKNQFEQFDSFKEKMLEMYENIISSCQKFTQQHLKTEL